MPPSPQPASPLERLTRVRVGTKNPPKLAAVKAAFEVVGWAPEADIFFVYDSGSNVSHESSAGSHTSRWLAAQISSIFSVPWCQLSGKTLGCSVAGGNSISRASCVLDAIRRVLHGRGDLVPPDRPSP